ncbi:MAG: SdiA-regulated domain-containing protein, partial [Pseudomonadota bacterium]
DNPPNKGLEGITVDPLSGTIFVVVEGRPRLLISISPDLSKILDATLLSRELGFTSPHADDEDLDVSGLAWSAETSDLWIVSDTGRRGFIFDPAQRTTKAFDLAYARDGETKTIKNAEGIALDEAGERLFILTDDGKKSRLFVFRMPVF